MPTSPQVGLSSAPVRCGGPSSPAAVPSALFSPSLDASRVTPSLIRALCAAFLPAPPACFSCYCTVTKAIFPPSPITTHPRASQQSRRQHRQPASAPVPIAAESTSKPWALGSRGYLDRYLLGSILRHLLLSYLSVHTSPPPSDPSTAKGPFRSRLFICSRPALVPNRRRRRTHTHSFQHLSRSPFPPPLSPQRCRDPILALAAEKPIRTGTSIRALRQPSQAGIPLAALPAVAALAALGALVAHLDQH